MTAQSADTKDKETDTATEKRAYKKRTAKPSSVVPAASLKEFDPSGHIKGDYGTYWIGTYPVGASQITNDLGVAEDVVDTTIRSYPPRANLIISGICFPTRINPITKRDKQLGIQERTEFHGSVVVWSRETVENLVDCLSRSWIRWRAKNGRLQDHGYLVTEMAAEARALVIARAKDLKVEPHLPAVFRPTSKDEPAANWIYVIKMEDGRRFPPLVENANLPGSVAALGIELP